MQIHKSKRNKIFYGVLNWGLGHASRSISIIKTLLEQNNDITIGSDGEALVLLKKAFPDLTTITLPSYDIHYGRPLLISVGLQLPKIVSVVKREHKKLIEIQGMHAFDLIISDHRYGIWHPNIPSIFVSHQLNLLRNKKNVSKIASRLHAKYLTRFNGFWIPDDPSIRYAGILPQNVHIHNKHYIGIQSKFQLNSPANNASKYDIVAVLSGPEPNRTQLERIIVSVAKKSSLKIALVRGTEKPINQKDPSDNLTVFDILVGYDLQMVIHQSDLYLGRAGYSTIMDLAHMQRKAILIPTPQQTEQEYLSHHLAANDLFTFVEESQFAKRPVSIITEMLNQ